MGRIFVQYPLLEKKMAWSHPLLRLVMLKSLKEQGVISELSYMHYLAQLDLPDSYDTQKERMTGGNYETDH